MKASHKNEVELLCEVENNEETSPERTYPRRKIEAAPVETLVGKVVASAQAFAGGGGEVGGRRFRVESWVKARDRGVEWEWDWGVEWEWEWEWDCDSNSKSESTIFIFEAVLDMDDDANAQIAELSPPRRNDKYGRAEGRE